MKQSQIIAAYNIINKLSDQKINLNTAFQIYKLKNKLKEYYDFQFAEEQKMLASRGATISDGSIHFPNQDDANDFVSEMRKMGEIEHDIAITPIDLSCSENIELSIREIEQLDGFIHITE